MRRLRRRKGSRGGDTQGRRAAETSCARRTAHGQGRSGAVGPLRLRPAGRGRAGRQRIARRSHLEHGHRDDVDRVGDDRVDPDRGHCRPSRPRPRRRRPSRCHLRRLRRHRRLRLAPYIVTFNFGVSDAAARTVIADAGGTVDSSLAVLRMYFVSLRPPTPRAPSLPTPASSRVDADRPRDVAGTPNDPSTAPSGRCRGSAGIRSTARSRRPATRGRDPRHRRRRVEPRARRQRRPRHVVRPRQPSDDRPERPRHLDGGHRRRRDEQRRGHRGRRLRGRQGHARHRARRGRHRPGQRRHPGRRLGDRARRGRHPHVVLEPRLLGRRCRRRSTTRGRRASCSSRRPATTARARRQFPAGDRGVIGVASTDVDDGLARARATTGQTVFIAAPGEGIATVNGSTVSGTSASAAVVAGAAALISASSVGASNGVIVSRLARNADPAGRRHRPATAA